MTIDAIRADQERLQAEWERDDAIWAAGAEEIRRVARSAAEDIMAAVAALPPDVADSVALNLYRDDSVTLNIIGGELIERRPSAKRLGEELGSTVHIFSDRRALILRLGDESPWLEIRRALWDISDAWQRTIYEPLGYGHLHEYLFSNVSDTPRP